MIPPMTTLASGRCTSAPAPVASAIGTNPRQATSAVISTGRSRVSAPSCIASWSACSARSFSMKLMMTRPFSTATPESAMKPMPALMESGMPRSSSAAMPPVSASGTPLKTSAASASEPRLMNSSTKISSSAIGTTMVSRLVAETSCSNCPPQAIQYPGGSFTFCVTWGFHVGNERPQVAAAHIGRHHDPPLAVLAADLIRARRRSDFRDR